MGKLTDLKIKRAVDNGLLHDGGGLRLQIRNGKKSWTFRFQIDGKTRDMGLGAYPAVPLSEAREKAADARKLLRQGTDPIKAKAARSGDAERPKVITFADVARQYVEAQQSKFASDKSLARWLRFERYACEAFGQKAVAEIDTDDVLALLTPLWSEKPETAAKLREWIEGALSFAKVKGKRQGENPARWRDHLEYTLPARNKAATVKHHASMPYAELPAFMVDLRSRDALSARMLEFVILTGVRTTEGREAEWSETARDLWVLPPHRHKMGKKTGKPHAVPLSRQAQELLATLPRSDPRYLFPGQREGRPLCRDAMLRLLDRMGCRYDVTIHGMRATFRTWAEEQTSFPRAVCETCLAHDVRSDVERAYQRSDVLEKRRALMQAWADFACSHA